jgi:hypothetical protein
MMSSRHALIDWAYTRVTWIITKGMQLRVVEAILKKLSQFGLFSET